jgi:beta-glucanase (GH16 family)
MLNRIIRAVPFAVWSLFSLLLPAGAMSDVPNAPMANYQQVFVQDFSKITTLSVSPHDLGGGVWIAHTPSNQDWFTFQDPGQPNHPFGISNGYLTIRVQKDGNDPNNWFSGYSGGLISSMDRHGKGFAQEYGYYEASMQTPGGPNTWPAFWLLDAPSLTDNTLADGSEIDVTESYGNFGTGNNQNPPGDPNQDGVTWHDWGHNGNASTGDGIFVHEPGMTTGFHTYGVDVEPDTITWYFDRKPVWRVATYDAVRRPMFVLENLALGGGTHNNATGSDYDWNLTPIPSDLKIKYIAVWASPNSPNFRGKAAAASSISAVAGKGKAQISWIAGGSGVNIYRGTSPGRESSKPIATGVTGTTYLDSDMENGKHYYYTVAAVNQSGIGSRSREISVTPEPDAGASAEFVKTDTVTQGSWKNVYGTDGYVLAGDKTSMPAYATLTTSASTVFTWAPTTDVRALQKAPPSNDRVASERHADRSLTYTIAAADNALHQIALYFIDWDHKGEVNKVEVKDAVFGNVLDTQTFANFGGGQYGVWKVRGHVTISVTNGAPTATNSQATVSGVFFGG